MVIIDYATTLQTISADHKIERYGLNIRATVCHSYNHSVYALTVRRLRSSTGNKEIIVIVQIASSSSSGYQINITTANDRKLLR